MELSTLPLRSRAAKLATARRATTATARPGPSCAEVALESRYFSRASAALDVEIAIDGRPRVDGRMVDVSEGGAKVAVGGVCVAGSRVEIAAILPPSQRSVALTGEIVWVEPSASESLIGVEWTAVEASAARAIGAFVERAAPLAWSGSPTLPRSVAEQYIPLVKRIARGLARSLPAHISVDDLVGAGFVGLVELYAKRPSADPDAFDQLAKVRVRGAMLDHLRRADPLARRARKGVRRIGEARVRLEASLGRAATHDEVQRALGVSAEAYQRLLSRADAAVPTSLDDDFGPDVLDVRAESAVDAVAASEARRALERAFNALPTRLQKVLELHYTEDLTLRAIGNLLGVSEARVSQLLGQAVGHLRRSCADASSTAA